MSSEWSGRRQHLLEVFLAGIDAVRGDRNVANFLRTVPVPDRLHVVAVGKAAQAMLNGLLRDHDSNVVSGLVITKPGYLDETTESDPRFTVISAGHPLPTRDSLAAGSCLRNYLGNLPEDAECLFLVSGGSSSLVELLPEAVSLADLKAMNAWLLGNGLGIREVNRVRQSVSLLKGGKALQFLGERTARVLLISDVPGDELAVIGSGLFCAPDEKQAMPGMLPDWIMRLAKLAEAYSQDSTVHRPVPHHVIATLGQAIEAAADAAAGKGYPVTVHRERLAGDAGEAGKKIVEILRASGPGIHVWGGETTVYLPPDPGRGGRCQHLALSAAVSMHPDERLLLLSAGTDGSDYAEGVAGAVVDPGTVPDEQARQQAIVSLERADSGTFLERYGQLIETGDTGTNVADMVIGMKSDASG